MEFYHEMTFCFEIWWSLIQNIWVKELPKYVLCITPKKKNENTLNHEEEWWKNQALGICQKPKHVKQALVRSMCIFCNKSTWYLTWPNLAKRKGTKPRGPKEEKKKVPHSVTTLAPQSALDSNPGSGRRSRCDGAIDLGWGPYPIKEHILYTNERRRRRRESGIKLLTSGYICSSNLGFFFIFSFQS
jgi:hypothetical protein